MSGEIRPIGADAVRRIVAGQAVNDLASAVKELVDNSLDAGSRSINIRLFNQGADIVEVSDDGAGVPMASRPFLATAHATSKIQSFEDIYNSSSVSDDASSSFRPLTMGFRGEALFCLANLSSKLIVATRTCHEPMAQKLEFHRDGSLDPSSVVTIPRKVGTTVAVVRFLDAVPVRRADMKRRMQKQRGKLLKWMEAYAIFSVGVRINLMDMIQSPSTGACRESTCLATTTNSTSLQETISSVLGPKFLAQLCPLTIDLSSAVVVQEQQQRQNDDESDDENEDETKANGSNNNNTTCLWKLDGWIAQARSTATLSSSCGSTKTADRASARTVQYYCINGRPVELPKVTRMLNELWRSFGQAKKPCCILRFTLPGNSFDINLSPDKREVHLTTEQQLLEVVRDEVAQLWASQTNGKFDMSNILSSSGRQGNDAAHGGDAAAENDDDDDGNNGDESPGTFNRRYAFSHDFSKAKMQHEYNDGRVKRQRTADDESSSHHNPTAATKDGNENTPANATADSSGQPPAAAEGAGTTTSAQGEEPPRKRVCIESAQKQPANSVAAALALPSLSSSSSSNRAAAAAAAAAATVTPSSLSGKQANAMALGSNGSIRSSSRGDKEETTTPSTTTTETTPSPPTDKVTLSERRQWHKTQSSFNNTSSRDDYQLDEIAAVTQQKQKQQEDHHNRGEEKKEGDSSISQGQEQQQQPAKRKSYGLERFGFQAIKRVSNDHFSKQPDAGGAGSGGGRGGSGDNNRTIYSEQQQQQQQGQQDQVPAPDQRAGNKAPRIRRVSSMVDEEDEQEESSSRQNDTAPTKDLEETAAQGRATAASPPADGTHNERKEDDSQQEKEQPNRKRDKVVWESFKGTDAVIACAREHRLAARNRKIRYRDENASTNVDSPVQETTSLTKADFERNLTVIGQFNMGFILAKSKDNHLWILDQHACDERYNFERLCQETVIHEQRLIAPLPLELAPCEELCVMDNMSIFENNGFRFVVDETKPPRHRLSLVALPHSGARDGRKAVQFGKEDVSALCAILGADGSTTSHEDVNGGTGTDGSGIFGNNAVRRYAGVSGGIGGGTGDTADRVIARLPKAIAMFASRACRGSVMIGTALSEKEMDRLIKNLGNLSDPWHCAHGRTTLSHVGDLSRLLARDERKASAHIAGPTVTVMSQQEEESDP